MPRPVLVTFFTWIGVNSTRIIAGAVLVGLLLPPLATLCRPLLLPALLLPLLVTLSRLDLGRFGLLMASPGLALLLVGWSLVGSPWLVALAADLAHVPEPFRAMMVTTAACAPLMASATISLLLGLDVALALVATVVATLLVPFTLPPIALQFGGLAVDMPAVRLTARLAIILCGSVLLAQVVRRTAGQHVFLLQRPAFDGLATIGLVVFAIGVMDGVTRELILNPFFVAEAALASVSVNLGLQAVTTLLFLPFGLRAALSAGLIAGNNNVGIVLAALEDAAPREFGIYVAVAQLPIFLLPALQKSLYGRLLTKAKES